MGSMSYVLEPSAGELARTARSLVSARKDPGDDREPGHSRRHLLIEAHTPRR